MQVDQADVTALPLADESFDYVASYLMPYHIIERHPAPAEATRVLRLGGRTFDYDPTRTQVFQWIHWAGRAPHRLIDTEDF